MTRRSSALVLLSSMLGSCVHAPLRPPPVAVAREQLTLMGGAFEIPAPCVAECRFHVNAIRGAVSCPGMAGVLIYGAGLEVFGSRPPFSQFQSEVQGQDRLGDATVYWGGTADGSARFCAIAVYPIAGFGTPHAVHSLCTTSSDVRTRTYAIEIIRSFRRAHDGADETCGMPVPISAKPPNNAMQLTRGGWMRIGASSSATRSS